MAAARTTDELLTQIESIRERAAQLAALDPALFTRRPKAESWSAAECVAHLNITADSYFGIWERAIAEARSAGSKGAEPFGLDFWGRILCWTMEPPPRVRFPAPPKFQPVELGPIERIVPDFLERQRRLGALLDSARGLALDRMRITSPFSSRVRYSVWSSFCLTA